jgi:mediator of RNA polymerase II transcription subunit 5
MALDILSVHISLIDLVARMLAIVEDYDCEGVGAYMIRFLNFLGFLTSSALGDPQTAVGHLGSVVLFLQSTLVRYEVEFIPSVLSDCLLKLGLQLFDHTFYLGERKLLPTHLLTTSAVIRMPKAELTPEEQNSFKVWYKALFDSTSEGIDDSILR